MTSIILRRSGLLSYFPSFILGTRNIIKQYRLWLKKILQDLDIVLYLTNLYEIALIIYVIQS